MQGWNMHIDWKQRPWTRVPVEPGVSADHGDYQEIKGTIDRLSGPHFLFTWVRDPIERCLSQYYHFKVSRGREEPTDDNIIKFLSSDACRNAAAGYLGMPGDESAETILGRYDMIGVTERFDDSVLLLRRTLPMAVDMSDILYVKSKDSSAGTLDEFGARFHRHLQYAEHSQRVRDFIDSELKPDNVVDFAIWKGANDRLDSQIHVIGLEEMEREKTEYKRLLAVARHKCQRYADIVCDYIHTDIGCGMSCLSRVDDSVRQNPAYFKQSLSEGSDNLTECSEQDILDSMARRKKNMRKQRRNEREETEWKEGNGSKDQEQDGRQQPHEHRWFRRRAKTRKHSTEEKIREIMKNSTKEGNREKMERKREEKKERRRKEWEERKRRQKSPELLSFAQVTRRAQSGST